MVGLFLNDAPLGTNCFPDRVSASAAVSQSEDRSQSSSDSRTYVTSILRYPRAIISIDPETLNPTEQFKKERDWALALTNNKDKRDALKKLFKKYGHVFATQVELGGLLHSTQTVIKTAEVCEHALLALFH